MSEEQNFVDIRRASNDTAVGLHHLTGAAGCAAGLLARALLSEGAVQKIAVVCRNEEQTRATLDDLRATCRRARILHIPAPEVAPYEPVRMDRARALDRIGALGVLDRGMWDVLVTSAQGWIRLAATPSAIAAHTCALTIGDEVSFDEWVDRLSQGGYQRAPLCEDPGTFSIRGSILDVWPPHLQAPLRAETDFDRLTSLLPYDPGTQRTARKNPIEQVWIGPASEYLCSKGQQGRVRQELRRICDAVSLPSSKTRALIDEVESGRTFVGATGYLPAFGPLSAICERLDEAYPLIFDDADAVVSEVEEQLTQAQDVHDALSDQVRFPPSAHYLTDDRLDQSIEGRCVYALHRTSSIGHERGFYALRSPSPDSPSLKLTAQDRLMSELRTVHSSQTGEGGLEPLLRQIDEWQNEGLSVSLSARSETQAQRLATLLEHRGVDVARTQELSLNSSEPILSLCVSTLSRGVVAKTEGYTLLTEEEIFGQRRAPKKTAKRSVENAIDDLRSLSPGDLVIHSEHGVGRYLGLEHKQLGGVFVDLLIVEYAAGDRLLLPVYRLNQIQRLSGDENARLDRLGGQTFSKTKSKAKRRVRILADQLLRLYAARRAVQRTPLPEPDDSFAEFEAAFPYQETPDQAAAIVDVVEDLQKDRVMDRLVCGDVGFGKTEVALRAAFLAANAGRQVAMLCPTTVLSEQHVRTFEARMGHTGLVVASLSRFTSKKAQAKTLSGLQRGSVDVVIGTHRLLSKDVHFKNLGLLIVDEEQRFGVGHKERLAEIKKSVDVLTLSATPIPRTLSLSLSGLRDMSLIATPPERRRSIRTLTARFDERVIRDAIAQELKRGGQVFYVHNRVQGLAERAALISRLLPECKVAVVHGQMTERHLETTMYRFVQGEYDVLCATAIIESGLDIPRANTIIIDRADIMGLSQLYQLRGRVGRSSQRAYCYLLLPSDAELSPESRSRIEAMERYSELGSGFQIATRDLEQRGAGELLGAEQSGFLERIGFELFSQMLEEAACELRGEPYLNEVDPELSLDVEALLPEDYVEDIGLRLSLYKRLASAQNADEVNAVASEIEDRFGRPSTTAIRFFEVMRLKTQLRRLRAVGLRASASSAHIHFRQDAPISIQGLLQLVAASSGRYQLSPDGSVKHRAAAGRHYENGLDHANHVVFELSQLLATSPIGGR